MRGHQGLLSNGRSKFQKGGNSFGNLIIFLLFVKIGLSGLSKEFCLSRGL